MRKKYQQEAFDEIKEYESKKQINENKVPSAY